MTKFEGLVCVFTNAACVDPQGKVVTNAAQFLGFTTVSEIAVGKSFLVSISAPSKDLAETQIVEICKKLLHNPVIETFKIINVVERPPITK